MPPNLSNQMSRIALLLTWDKNSVRFVIIVQLGPGWFVSWKRVVMTTPTGNPFLDSISVDSWRWVNPSGGPLVIEYYFDNDFSTWSSSEKTAYRGAFQAWANVANFTIQETFVESNATFVAHSLSNLQMNDAFSVQPGYTLFGAHATPNDPNLTQIDGYFNYQTYSWPSDGIVYDTGGLVSGGWGFKTFLHEIGHGLGLAHPHSTNGPSPLMPGVNDSNDFGDNNLNQGLFTVMSYNRGWEAVQNPQDNGISDFGYNYGPGAFDIALIQYLYGANTSFNNGNNTYTITDNGAWTSIWDTGGTDEIVYNGIHDVIIDLRSATLDNTTHGGGYLSYVINSGGNKFYGGYTIAADYTSVLPNQGGETDVIIENAAGGSGDDILRGNSIANILIGNGGDDKMYGYGGNDTFRFSNGHGANSGELVAGGSGFDKIELRSSSNTNFDFRGFDVTSIEEIEFYADGSNVDKTAVFNAEEFDTSGEFSSALHIDGNGTSGSTEKIKIYMGDVTVLDISVWTFQQWGGQNELITIYGDASSETITGSSRKDNLIGKGGVDTISGNYGSDKIWGGKGADTLWGNAGGDVIYGGLGNDLIWGGHHNDTLWGQSGADVLKGGTGSDKIRGGGQNDKIYGNNGNDVLLGGNGSDKIWGGSQNDEIWGGAGNDVLWGNSGQDTFFFNNTWGNDVIKDFDRGSDKINFRFDSNINSISDLTIINNGVFGFGGDIVISYGANSITLIDVENISASDFII